MQLLSRRWAGTVLRTLVTGPKRFRDIAAVIPGITDSSLSQRLKDLESAGVVTRVVLPSTPVRVEYRLTEKGSALGEILLYVNGWALDWIDLPAAQDRRPRKASELPGGTGD
ncbi:winged helix-turn-helix transcriptional regulator [Mycolicibacterium fluoranthenivorans]|uniref:Transcriptional regulator, HxlR family n=1 Tax=Mycolicibacterium fluoranthenivorans TaxID=258505 RepID=A0A1G4WA79_9MYCO|nr:helix-turn-helix domain-containing protein [Mycolicibacterium fluoranthenivorans]SCX19293.1 transcriptional regulator, HxlR family [Mycolicibacterium fluoranthenivorans]